MKDIFVNIGERKIPLYFGMREFNEIEETVGNLGNIKELIMEGKERGKNLTAVIRILGNAGLRQAGEDADITEDFLLDHMDPRVIMAYQIAVIACMSRDENSQAVTEEREDKDRDLVLEEIAAKKKPKNSHTGG